MSNTQHLFHPRSLTKALAANNPLKDGQIPAAARKVLEEWHAMITDGSIHKQNEKKLQPEFFRDLCGTVLGYKSFSQKDLCTSNMDIAMLGRKLSTVAQAAQYAENSKGLKQLL